MNRILFNEGGQPMYLDDFELLQKRQEVALSTLLKCLCEGVSVLIAGGEVEDVQETETGYRVNVNAGKALINGDIVEWADMDSEIAGSVEELYLCVNKTKGVPREFENGATHYCREEDVVTVSTTNEGAAGYIDLLNPNRFAEVLKNVLGLNNYRPWETVEISKDYIHNGFIVSIKYDVGRDYLLVKLMVSSNETSWGENVERCLFYWSNALLGQSLKGKYSPVVFKGNDGGVYSDIIEWCNDDNECRLLGYDGEAVKHGPAGKIEGVFNIYL